MHDGIRKDNKPLYLEENAGDRTYLSSTLLLVKNEKLKSIQLKNIEEHVKLLLFEKFINGKVVLVLISILFCNIQHNINNNILDDVNKKINQKAQAS